MSCNSPYGAEVPPAGERYFAGVREPLMGKLKPGICVFISKNYGLLNP